MGTTGTLSKVSLCHDVCSISILINSMAILTRYMNTTIQTKEQSREEYDFLQNKFSIVSIQKFQLNAKIEKNVNQQIVLRQHISSNQEKKYDDLARFEIDCLEIELKGMQSAFDKISLIDQECRTDMDRAADKFREVDGS